MTSLHIRQKLLPALLSRGQFILALHEYNVQNTYSFSVSKELRIYPLFQTAAGKLVKDLGYGMSISSIVSSVSFAVCLFFYLYIIGSFFGITVYPLLNRFTFDAIFQEHIMNEFLDSTIVMIATTSWFLFSVRNRAVRYFFSIYGGTGIILALLSPDNIVFDIIVFLSLPLIIGVILYYHYRKRQDNLLNFNAKLTLQYVSLAVIAISAIGIVVQVSAVFLTPDLNSSIGDGPANELFLLLSSFSSIYIFLLVFGLAVKVIFKEASSRLKLNIKEDITSDHILSDDEDYYKQNRVKKQTKIALLLLAIVLSIVLVLIPQHPLINKDNQYIGVDTRQYAIWIEELARSENVFDLIYQAFIVQGQDGDRPLSLLFLFSVYQIAGGVGGGGNTSLAEVIEHFPLILGPGIVLAFYFLTVEITRNEKIALIASFLAAVSYHTLVGIYAGFYANWLALIIGYTSIAFLFRYLRTGRYFDIIAFSTLLIGVLLLHVYTWTVLAAVAGIFLIVMLLVVVWKKKSNKDISNGKNHFTNKRRMIIWLLLAIVLSIGVDIAKVSFTGSSGGLVQDVEVAQRSLDIERFDFRFVILDATMHHGFGGVFSNFIILLLGLFWVLKSNMRDPGTIFLMIFLSAGLVPLFFGSATLQTRIFYDIPFEIPAAIALYHISSKSGSMLATLAACTWLVAISLVTVMNYYFIPLS
jgi:hypothetical protein